MKNKHIFLVAEQERYHNIPLLLAPVSQENIVIDWKSTFNEAINYFIYMFKF
jgi:hypothetical protein